MVEGTEYQVRQYIFGNRTSFSVEDNRMLQQSIGGACQMNSLSLALDETCSTQFRQLTKLSFVN